jgi:Ca2+-binding RTX toxin-like protein
MATLKYGNGGIRYDLATIQTGTFTSITPTQLIITTTEGWKIIGTGSFSLSGDTITGGTISGYGIYKSDGALYASMTGLSLSVSTYNYYANRGDGLGLFNSVLSGNDTITGGNGNDSFLATSGGDFYNGGAGIDTVVYSDTRASHTITKTTGSPTVTVSKSNTSAVDALVDVDRLYFSDNKAIAFDVDANAGKVYRLYQAAFDRTPDAGGLGVWINQMDNGQSLEWVSAQFQTSQEFQLKYGSNVSTDQFVTLLYQNVLHRSPDSGGLSAWKGALDAGAQSRAQVLAGFSESTENQIALIGSIQNGIEYTPA